MTLPRSHYEAQEPPGAIATYTGRWITPLDPDPKDIDIRDIAHSLAQQCRFTGHTRVPYSVAQHSYLASIICDEADALWGLVHDGTETYLSDLARPIKQMPGFGEQYRKVEEVLMRAVCDRFNLPYQMPESVARADRLLLRAEQRDLMADGNQGNEPAWEGTIEPWDAQRSEREFLRRYRTLTGEKVSIPSGRVQLGSKPPIRGWGFMKPRR